MPTLFALLCACTAETEPTCLRCNGTGWERPLNLARLFHVAACDQLGLDPDGRTLSAVARAIGEHAPIYHQRVTGKTGMTAATLAKWLDGLEAETGTRLAVSIGPE